MIRKLAALAFAVLLAAPGLLLAATPVNINKADATTIATSLEGIGPAKAQAIVAWRDEHGPFKTVDELSQVKGIGAATLERNRASILLTDEASETPKPVAPKKHKSRKAGTAE